MGTIKVEEWRRVFVFLHLFFEVGVLNFLSS